MFSIAINSQNSKDFSSEGIEALRGKISQCRELEIRISQKTGRRDTPERIILLAEIAKAQAFLSLFTSEDEIDSPDYHDRYLVAERLWQDSLGGDEMAFVAYLVDWRCESILPQIFFSREEMISMQEHALNLNPAPEIKRLFRWLTQKI